MISVPAGNNKKPTHTCPECSRLWGAYAQATERHLELLRSIPRIIRFSEQVMELEERMAAVAEERERAWQAVREHEERVHGQVAR